MYLKRLEIVGFKSFADHIKLDFEPGVTGVVGPNGCGKSNIIDAIRWCLGEMSAKSLRSNLMLDVVFNGSGSRPPQNLSEVTLTFDNADKKLPIDFAEVSISRKLFRSGESEYFINRNQCRLRDIRELFLDTGMGEDGYSFMAQGKVEWILQAKPEDRRELFEEAAGVSKYRARREEALRKLDRVQLDLSRLADIISVTQDQVRKLENAVNKAKTYQRIKEQLKTAEITDWLYQTSTGDDQLAQINLRLNEAREKVEKLNTQIHQTDSELSQLRLASTQTEEKLLSANTQLNQIETQIKVNEERQNNSIQRQQEIVAQTANLVAQIEREKTRISELLNQETNQVKSLEQVKADGQSVESDFGQAQTAHDAALKNLEEKRSQVKSIRDQILNRAQERARLQKESSQLTSDVSRLESESENREKETKKIEAQIEEISKLLGSTQNQANELQNQQTQKTSNLENLTHHFAKVENKENALRDDLLSLSEAIARLNGQIHSIQNQQSQDPYLAGAQAVRQKNFSGIFGTIGQLIDCPEKDRDLVSATLGEHLDDLVAQSVGDAQKVIEFLKIEGKGRARVWILDKITAKPAPHNNLTGNPSAQALESIIQCNATIKPLINHLCQSLWIQDSTVFGDGFLNGGVDPSKWKSHVPHRLDELQKTLQSKTKIKENLELDIEKVLTEKSQIKNNRETALKELEEFRIRNQVTQEELNKLSERLKLHQDELQVVREEITHSTAERQKAQQDLEICTNRFQELFNLEKEDHSQLDLLQQELTELQQIHAQASGDLSVKLERHNSFQEKLNWQSSIVQQIQNDLQNLKQAIENQEKTIQQFNLDLENAKKSEIEAKSQIESQMQNRQTAADLCESIQKKRVEFSDQISQLDSQLSSTRKELNELQEVAHQEQINETTLKSKLESIHQKLADQYEMTMAQAKEQFTPAPADPEALEKLKKRVSGMGPVNLAAPQEHAELMEKNNFMVTQQNDLVKAREDLREVISKINATTREHFRETFTQVRENFRNIYAKLFQGGEADLHFTNEADILSTGIDIFCQPPGKKLLHISLMSGGEKALTAVALLFAFFMVRPSPLALLDEVDAPLDDANVARFVKMIQEFAQNSQFILITHNKLTMEAAHSLYGVTMEELGVSKIISTRLVKEKKSAPAQPSSV